MNNPSSLYYSGCSRLSCLFVIVELLSSCWLRTYSDACKLLEFHRFSFSPAFAVSGRFHSFLGINYMHLTVDYFLRLIYQWHVHKLVPNIHTHIVGINWCTVLWLTSGRKFGPKSEIRWWTYTNPLRHNLGRSYVLIKLWFLTVVYINYK